MNNKEVEIFVLDENETTKRKIPFTQRVAIFAIAFVLMTFLAFFLCLLICKCLPNAEGILALIFAVYFMHKEKVWFYKLYLKMFKK
jgi:NhaP-type Na+/H+ or K+/H+ antiporter